MKSNVIKITIFLIVSCILIFIDQLTKKIATLNLYKKPQVVIIDNVFELVYVENRGAAFGILQGKQLLFYILTIIILITILYLLYKTSLNKTNILYYVCLLLIFSGAIGNFIDRLKNKYVVDFLYFKLIDFPVFNFADILITIGMILMFIYLAFSNPNKNI